MKKMIMVVMLVMAMATGCQSNVKEIGKGMYRYTLTPNEWITVYASMDIKTAAESIMNYVEEEPYVSDEYLEEMAFNSQMNDWAN